jgi:hypothetical protein
MTKNNITIDCKANGTLIGIKCAIEQIKRKIQRCLDGKIDEINIVIRDLETIDKIEKEILESEFSVFWATSDKILFSIPYPS